MSFKTYLTAFSLATATIAISAPAALAKDHRANHDQRGHHARVITVHCPPGLAKKDPACVPPGQARARSDDRRHYDRDRRDHLRTGDIIDLRHVHIVTRPGLYGLNDPRRNERYAVVDGRLVRVDESTGKVLNIIRLIDAILD